MQNEGTNVYNNQNEHNLSHTSSVSLDHASDQMHLDQSYHACFNR